MTPEQYERIRTLFFAAREREPAERADFLRRECGSEPELRREVETLLASDGRVDSFLESPALGPSFVVGKPESLFAGAEDGATSRQGPRAAGAGRVLPPHPERIGPYRVLDVLGAGGMGVVYRAQQESPRRIVALKVIRPGLESCEALKRFEHEGQVLARLQHPGIAQVFEAGTADAGYGPQPYFAMELIRGQPLTDYACGRRLSIRARLELMIRVCDAVQHAHQKGVIHRDLKPGNILVDEDGQPRILDFGVARITDADVRATTLQTAVGQLVGTLAYMSPEQVAGDPQQLDTRADVYALGVICFEVLTGQVPLEVADKTIPQAARVIAEEGPRSLGTVNRAFRGDLATIVAKALEKEKERRYPSASDLAADLRRYLADQPISARPTTTFYQLRKFARRNRPLVGAALIALLALVVGIVGTTSQAVRATRERNRALGAEQLAERRRGEAEVQRAEAQRQAAIAQAVNDFLNKDLLAAANPEKGGRNTTVREVLDHAAEVIGDRFKEQPLIEAAICSTLGETYARLGDYKQAERHLRRVLAIHLASSGENDPATHTALNDLGIVCERQGQWDEAERLLLAALAGRRRLHGDDHPDTLNSMNNLGTLYFSQDRLAEAEPLFVTSLEGHRRLWGEDHEATLNALNNLGNVYAWQGRDEQAEPLMRATLEGKVRALGAEHPKTLVSMSNLAALYIKREQYDAAEPLCTRALDIRRRVLGPEHPSTLKLVGNLALVYAGQRRYGEAEVLYQEALAAQRRTLGEAHQDTLRTLHNLAALYRKQGDFERADPLYVQVLEGRRQVLGEQHRETLESFAGLLTTLIGLQRYAEAESLGQQCFELHAAVYGPTHAETAAVARLMADLYTGWNKPEQAAEWQTRLAATRPATAATQPVTGDATPP